MWSQTVKKKIQYTAKITTNEPEKFKKKFRNFFKSWNVIEEHMTIGDILLGSGLCIERKTTNDFDSSILDGRLERQLYNMSHNYDLSVVAVTGTINASRWNKYKVKGRTNRIIARMATIAMSYPNVRVIRVDNDRQLFQLITKLYTKYEMKNNVKKPKARLRNNTSEKDIATTLLTAVPGIGIKRAEKLINDNNLHSLIHMDFDGLLEIMPKKSAETFFSLFSDKKK